MSHGGKGSTRRPRQISDEQEQANWDAIFKPKKQSDDVPVTDQHNHNTNQQGDSLGQ